MSDPLDPKAAGARRLRDKVCIVTGAGQGIGRAAAKRLGQEGGKIVVADRVEAAARRVVDELEQHKVEAAPAIVDVGTLSGAEQLMTLALERFGRIDVLVNNVGGTIWIKPFHLYTEEQVHQELERSLLPTLWCCLAVLPIMMKQKAGSIVNIGSQSPRGIHRLPYAASKGGVLAMTKVLSMEYGAHAIRVNAVSPGGTDIDDRITDRRVIAPGVLADDPADAARYEREMKAHIQSQKALQRRGLTEDQAAAIAFLASDDASFITGQVIDCSGGQG
jgi:NAD(P)-dependent dehydrogenase (short-subunit alcohol dehydrogenase family)